MHWSFSNTSRVFVGLFYAAGQTPAKRTHAIRDNRSVRGKEKCDGATRRPPGSRLRREDNAEVRCVVRYLPH